MIDYFTSLLLEQSIGIEFERIKSNMELSSIKIPYTIKYIDLMTKYFEIREDFEKCQILLQYRNSRNSHEKNYING